MIRCLSIILGLITVLATPVLAQQSPVNLVINEIYYDHPGPDIGHEWVELANTGSVSIEIDTSGDSPWRFFDGQNHKLSATSSVMILPQSYLIIAKDPEVFGKDYPNISVQIVKSPLTLANSGDTLKLSSDGGKTYFAEVTYEPSLGGKGNKKSLERDEQGWHESSQDGGTPGVQNSPRFIASEQAAQSGQESQPTTNAPSKPVDNYEQEVLMQVDIKTVKAQSQGTEVKTTGRVSVPPGTISNTAMYVEDETGGIQVYSQNFPTLSLGDTVVIIGRRSQSNGENRVTSHKDSIQVMSQDAPATPKQISLALITQEFEGQLVQAEGTIEIDSGKLWLQQDQSIIEVVIRSSTNIEKPSWRDNDTLSIIGVISPYKGVMRILPRFQGDLNWSPQNEPVTANTANEVEEEHSASSDESVIQDEEDNRKETTNRSEPKQSKSKSNKAKKNEQPASDSQLNPVINQVKGLFTDQPYQQANTSEESIATQSNPQPASRSNSGLPYTVYGTILGILGASLWHNRSTLQKVPTILKGWHNNWHRQ